MRMLCSVGSMLASMEVVTLAQLGYLPGTVAVFGVMAFVTFFEIGFGLIPWLIVADIFDANGEKREMRGNGKAWVKVCAVLERVARGVLFCKKKCRWVKRGGALSSFFPCGKKVVTVPG